MAFRSMLFLLSILVFLCPSEGKLHWPKSVADLELNDQWKFDYPHHKDFTKALRKFVSTYHLKEYDLSVIRPSTGCALRPLSNTLFADAPSSTEMCGVTPTLLYTQQHSGSTLFREYLTYIPRLYPKHALFCCDKPQCTTDKDLAVVAYTKMFCALNATREIDYLFVGLQEKHWPWHNEQLSLDLPQHYGMKVIMEIRLNFLSWSFAGASFHSDAREKHLPPERYMDLKDLRVNYRKYYSTLYCKLKERGVEVIFLTYEDLVSRPQETMDKVLDLIGHPRMTFDTSTNGHHFPLADRISNKDEVVSYLKKNDPESLCLLYENCSFPPVDCDTQELYDHVPMSPLCRGFLSKERCSYDSPEEKADLARWDKREKALEAKTTQMREEQGVSLEKIREYIRTERKKADDSDREKLEREEKKKRREEEIHKEIEKRERRDQKDKERQERKDEKEKYKEEKERAKQEKEEEKRKRKALKEQREKATQSQD
mmetsp:Transcript_33115/g.51762  ORF Transcript_33115/g.51762 Transcript_33115/m.51762 type:complete len:485 (-) Transcript_33115:47-1501(-)|eukprot:CAMPEP_0201512534 /NCGR_PEP_ID=MMETSP0161_2-20130828/4769_1 /ASSEMBLY_ACC=CAM_ASM_000251 /TAXON_ID=180227 /ORGANISM="Neoparamoeba aestuarina, Strain SoJaBio B1-5/56/2" /LENGTH=484 /DNA_ID=CAMNT_0047908413 /DNA_START=29 /DNA_END=1483 /DNA_ORIENTATION=+